MTSPSFFLFALLIAISIILSISSSFFVAADPFSTSNWNCFAKMIISQIAFENLPSSSPSAEKQQRINKFQEAVNYQLMSSGLSSFSELPCWSSNITSVLELHKQNFTQNQYQNWQRSVQCYGSKCPSSFPTQGELVSILGDATTAAKNAIMNVSVVEGSSTAATLGFWISMISEMVASAHNPLQVCTLYDSQFPASEGGDDSGQKFLIKYGSYSNMKLSSFVGSVGGLLIDANTNLDHPLLDFPETVAQLNVYVNSLQNDFTSITPSQKNNIDVNSWIHSSRSVCGDVIYDKGRLISGGDEAVSNDYAIAVRNALQKQLLLAGYHLASYLENHLML